MDDPRTIIIKSLDIHSCRVELSDSPIVLLCGGRVPQKDHPEDPEPPLASFRHALTRANSSYELFRPEEITTWQSDGVYKNLMDFEADLANICTLVVIVLESAGAIAELGAFSQLPELSKKIIAIKSNEFTGDPSFISLGILRYIAEAHQSSVKTYPWEVAHPHTISNEVIDDAANDIKDELDRLKKSHVFKINNGAHVITLICSLIVLFVALKESEILQYLNQLNISTGKPELRRMLFLLEKFNLVKRIEYSDSSFYIKGKDDHHGLRLAFTEGSTIDRLRISMDCMEFYNSSNSDRHRSRVIKISIDGGIE